MSEDKTQKKMAINPTSPGVFLAKRSELEELTKGIDSMFGDFRRSFDSLIKPLFPTASDMEHVLTLPIRYAPIDLIDNGDSYTIFAELPGITSDMVDVQVSKEGLVIRADIRHEGDGRELNYIHRERTYSSVQRYVSFPDEVVSEKVEGSMKNGVLELKIPKQEPAPEEKPVKVEIK